MVTARSTDPEAVALMAEMAARGGMQDAWNPLGNYLLELWDADPSGDTAVKVARVFGHLPAECQRFLPAPLGLEYLGRLDPAAAAGAMAELLTGGLQYFPAFADVGEADVFVGRVQSWLGPGAEYLGSHPFVRVFQVAHWIDAGVAFAAADRAGFLWCLGTD